MTEQPATLDEARRAEGANLLATLSTYVERRDWFELRIAEYVYLARVYHATWSEIAAALGVSRQAAHNRYSDDCRRRAAAARYGRSSS